MRVLVVGGYGLIGGYVVARLAGAGHEVVGAGRDIDTAARRFPQVRWIKADLARYSAAQWAPLLRGMDAVVNCAGALQDSPRDDLEAVHVGGVTALASAARDAGVSRFVHISAAGVESMPGAFGRTKLQAEEALQKIDLDWIVLRPALVLAPAAFGGSALLRGLAAFPMVIPAVHADSLIHVVFVHDVAEAVVCALAAQARVRTAIDLAADPPERLGDILKDLRAWLGLRPAPIVEAPEAAARLASAAADVLSLLGWRSPMRAAAMQQLRHGVAGDPQDTAGLLGRRAHGLPAILAAEPSGVQERWFAKLYFAKPLALATLAAFWIASGLIGLWRAGLAVSVLTSTGFGAGVATACVATGAAADILLGVLVCHRRSAPWGLRGMVALSAAYLIGAAIWRPDLWADPLGAMVKVIPGAVLALVTLAMMDER